MRRPYAPRITAIIAEAARKAGLERKKFEMIEWPERSIRDALALVGGVFAGLWAVVLWQAMQ